MEDLKAYSYPLNFKENIANVVIDIYQNTKNMNLNRYGKQNGIVTDVILLIKCQLNVQFKDRNYDIPISIIIPKKFPFEPPEFYLDKMQDFCINPKNSDIDALNWRILTNSLKNWDFYNNTSILTVLKEILNSFNKNFPIYRQSNVIYQKPQQNPLIETSSHSFQSQSVYNPPLDSNKNISPNRVLSQSQPLINPHNLQNVVQYGNQNINTSGNNLQIDNNTLKRIMVEELKLLIEPKIKEETKKLKQHEEKLNNYRNEFRVQNEKLSKFVEKKDEIMEQVSSALKNIQIEITGILSYLEQNKNKVMDLNNLEEYINISNSHVVNLISLECTIEDFISIYKRLSEKNVIDFMEMVKNIRVLTREQFKIRFYKEKLLNKLN